MLNEKNHVLDQFGKRTYVLPSDYENSDFLDQLNLQYRHKAIISFVKIHFNINVQTFFLIQKIMTTRNLQCHYEVPYQISNEQFKNDISRELDEVDSISTQNNITTCFRKVLITAQIINNKVLEKKSNKRSHSSGQKHRSRSQEKFSN